MDSKETIPYTNQQYDSLSKLSKYIHIHNAPYILSRGHNYNNMHLYEINKARHHSFRKEDNQMIINESNNAWRYISTIKSKKWHQVNLILYSQINNLLWFIFDPKRGTNESYEWELMVYSIQHKQSSYLFSFLYGILFINNNTLHI